MMQNAHPRSLIDFAALCMLENAQAKAFAICEHLCTPGLDAKNIWEKPDILASSEVFRLLTELLSRSHSSVQGSKPTTDSQCPRRCSGCQISCKKLCLHGKSVRKIGFLCNMCHSAPLDFLCFAEEHGTHIDYAHPRQVGDTTLPRHSLKAHAATSQYSLDMPRQDIYMPLTPTDLQE